MLQWLITVVIGMLLVGVQCLNSYTNLCPDVVANIRSSFPVVGDASNCIFVWSECAVPAWLGLLPAKQVRPFPQNVLVGGILETVKDMNGTLADGHSLTTFPSDTTWRSALETGTQIVPVLASPTQPTLWSLLGLLWTPFKTPVTSTLGQPLSVTRLDHVTDADIEGLRARFLAAVE
jgi:hypothetical protein